MSKKTNEERLAQYGSLDLETTLRGALFRLSQDAYQPPEGEGRFKMPHRSTYDTGTLERAITELMVRRAQTAALEQQLDQALTVLTGWQMTDFVEFQSDPNGPDGWQCSLCGAWVKAEWVHHERDAVGRALPSHPTPPPTFFPHEEGCMSAQTNALLTPMDQPGEGE